MVHCFQNIWFNKRMQSMHPHEHQNGHQLSTKWALGSDQSSVKLWLVQAMNWQLSGHGEGVPEVTIHKLGN